MYEYGININTKSGITYQNCKKLILINVKISSMNNIFAQTEGANL